LVGVAVGAGVAVGVGAGVGMDSGLGMGSGVAVGLGVDVGAGWSVGVAAGASMFVKLLGKLAFVGSSAEGPPSCTTSSTATITDIAMVNTLIIQF
jgi:hypothetical protein